MFTTTVAIIIGEIGPACRQQEVGPLPGIARPCPDEQRSARGAAQGSTHGLGRL